jgi:hypothetical protein
MGDGLGRCVELARRLERRHNFAHPADNLGLGVAPCLFVDLVQGQAAGDSHIPSQRALRPRCINAVGHQLVQRRKQGFGPFAALEHHQIAAGARLRRRHIFLVVQRRHHALHRLRIEVRQEQMHVVQRCVLLDAPCQRRAHHAAEQLGDVGVILRAAERHHHFGARAVPAGGQTGLEEHHADVLVRVDARGLHLAHAAAAHVQITGVVHGVRRLAFVQTAPDGALDHGQRIGQIGLGQLLGRAVVHLHHQHRPDGRSCSSLQ